MQKTKYLILMVSLLLFAALIVTACGQEPAAQQESSQPEEKAAESETISFAMSGGYPPFNYFDEKNELTGFDVEVGIEVAKRMGREYEPITTAWDGIIEGLRAGRYDGILGSMGITEDRKKIVDFSDPYYYSGAQLIVRADSGIDSPEDLPEDAAIAVATGETYTEDAIALVGDDNVRFYEDPIQSMMDLDNGRITAIITDRIVGLNAFQEKGYDFKLAGSTLRTEKMAVAVQKGDAELLGQINDALTAMREDGTMEEISNKWFGTDITNP